MQPKIKAKILLGILSLSCTLGCICPLHPTHAATLSVTRGEQVGPITIQDLEGLCDNYDNFPTEGGRNNLSTTLTRIDDSIILLNLFDDADQVTMDNLCHALWIAHRCSTISENPVIQERLANYIIQNHVNVNELDTHGISLLHYAASFGDTCYHFMWDLLTRSNADINLQDINGNTPLHVAVISRQPCVIDVLLPFYDPFINPEYTPPYARARTDIINNEGFIPLEIARQQNDEYILRRLAYRGVR